MTQRVVAIVGPTASGKTGLGIAIARRLAEAGERAEIVNADAYQKYRGMDIGTAKPTAEEQAAVPHHLIDIIDPEDTMSVARFQQLARETIADLQSRGIRPILVGGSGLYARAAIDDITFPGTDPDVRTRLEEREKTEGAGALFDELRAKAPEAAARMDPRNPRRTIRALEVIELTGKPYSASLPRYRYVIPSVQIGLDLDRPDLGHRIQADVGRWVHRRSRTVAPASGCHRRTCARLSADHRPAGRHLGCERRLRGHRTENQATRPQTVGMVRP